MDQLCQATEETILAAMQTDAVIMVIYGLKLTLIYTTIQRIGGRKILFIELFE